MTAAPLHPPLGSADAIAAWSKQLKPWLTALREARLRINLPALATVSDMENLWISVFAPTERRNNPKVWTLLIEALELLELLARIDQMSAWCLLCDAASIARTFELYGPQLIPTGSVILPQYVIHIDGEELVDATETVVQSCIRLVIVNEHTSFKYTQVKALLLQHWRERHDGQELNRETDGRVKVSLDFRASMDFEDQAETGYVFTQIQNIAFAHADLSLLAPIRNGDDQEEDDEDDEEEEQVAEETVLPSEAVNHHEASIVRDENGENTPPARIPQRNPNPPPRGPFVIESFRFALLDQPVSNILLYMLNEAGKSGMCMSHVTVSTLWHERLHHSVIGGFLLNQLVPWRGRRDSLGIQHLTLDLGGFDAAGVRAFSTAIAHSRSLRTFQFRADQFTEENPNQVEGEVWWPWLAYALFSGDADHHIEKVFLNLENFDKSHVENIRQVLAHSDPLAYLFQRALGSNHEALPPSSGPAMAASLNRSALLRLGHHRVIREGDDEIPGVRVGEPGVTYQVVRNRPDEDYIEILLPGTGVCWTDRSELIEVQPLTRRERHPIRECTVERLNDATAPAFIELLPLIGEPFERMVIEIEGTMTSAVLDAIRTSCRNLKHIGVHLAPSVQSPTLEWLFKPMEVEWTFQSLVIDVPEVNPAIWLPLFTHLSDATNALTKSLRELHVTIPSTRYPRDDQADQVLTMLGDMLEKNHRLVRCEVVKCWEAEFNKHKDRIMAHHDEPLCVEKTPLVPAAKLAFLSATTPLRPTASDEDQDRKRVKHSHSARTKLDSHILRTIMEMAAESEHRVCGIARSNLARPDVVIE